VIDAVTYAGGWIYDRVTAGWDVTVLVDDGDDLRPLHILGAEILGLTSVLADWEDRPHPQTVAVSADLLERDPRVLAHVRNALEQGGTEVTLWGEGVPAEIDHSVGAAQHHLSGAARAFKARALAAVNESASVGATEAFRCGVMASVAADLVRAS
jgi:hypothetical protein